jgi:ABC-type multidrug transport system fused ATPase/permease subunit
MVIGEFIYQISCSTYLPNYAVTVLWYAGRARSGGDIIRLPEDETSKLMKDHVPASLHFSSISYTLNNSTILDSISGSIKPGQVLAIMGASGAGKSTFLDILARKRKKGVVSGTTLVNGREVPDEMFKDVMGFVDQEDTHEYINCVRDCALQCAAEAAKGPESRGEKVQDVGDYA